LRLKTHHQLSNRMTLISLLMPPSILLLLKRATFLKWSNYIQINFWDLNHFSTIALLLLRRNLRERTGVDWREKTKNNSVRSSPSHVYFIIGKDLNVNIKYYTGFDFYDSRWRRLLYLHTHTHTPKIPVSNCCTFFKNCSLQIGSEILCIRLYFICARPFFHLHSILNLYHTRLPSSVLYMYIHTETASTLYHYYLHYSICVILGCVFFFKSSCYASCTTYIYYILTAES
jgi:hypothetical protein